MYDDNKDGVLETITAGKMLMDLYRSMNKEFHPTATDIASFARIFDKDNKGKITIEDMNKFAFKYYCNEEYWLIVVDGFILHELQFNGRSVQNSLVILMWCFMETNENEWKQTLWRVDEFEKRGQRL